MTEMAGRLEACPRNPYLPEAPTSGPGAGAPVVVAGPRPLAVWAAGAAVPEVEGLPVGGGRRVATGELVVVGAHGGAGASTLAGLLGAVDGGRAWPTGSGGVRPRVVVAARTDARGIDAAQRAAMQWARGGTGVDLVGVVWVADAPGRLPVELRRRRDHVSGAFPESFQVPWVDAWRMGPADGRPAPRRALRGLDILMQDDQRDEDQ